MVADGNIFKGCFVQAVQFPARDNSIPFGANIQQDRVFINCKDFTLDDLPTTRLDTFVFFQQLGKIIIYRFGLGVRIYSCLLFLEIIQIILGSYLFLLLTFSLTTAFLQEVF